MRLPTIRSLGVLFLLSGLGTSALAQTPEVVDVDAHGPGVGVEQNLGGMTGAAFSYDTGKFHIDVIGSFDRYNEAAPEDDTTLFGLAGRFFYELHSMPSADFSIGGGLGLVLVDQGDFSDTSIVLEGAAQIRIWIVPNVSLSGSLGLAILTADDGEVQGGPIGGDRSADSIYGIGGQLTGALGLFYYFR